MRQFYIYFSKSQPLVGQLYLEFPIIGPLGQLTWTHYRYLLPIKDEKFAKI
jgi:hypothetical protein